MNKYLAFDIEIFKTIPEEATDWKQYRPFGISCAAALASDEDKAKLWWSSDNGPMSAAECRTMLSYLFTMQAKGYTILTWNGLGFDFDVLAEESGEHYLCAQLALHHVDMFFHVFCLLGYAPGLDKAAKGMGLPGKTEGVDGAKAPELWAAGEYEKVLEYVSQDVRTTLDLALAVEKASRLQWASKNGRLTGTVIPQWLPVCKANELPLPDTSWMKDPWQRSKFIGWTNP